MRVAVVSPLPVAARGGMEESPVANGDAGLAGLKVAERLETLSVVCEERTCPPGLAAEEAEEGAALLAGEVPHGGPCGGGLLLAAVEDGPPSLGNGAFSGKGEGAEPGLNLTAKPGGENGVGPVAEGGPSSSSPPLGVNGDLDAKPPLLGSEGGLGERQAVQSSDSSASSSSESESEESESDTDTDSSSSVSSSSSCLPMLSEDDDQQNKNEDKSCGTTKNGELSEREPLCVEDLTIILPESVELMPFGKISSIIEHLVIIESQKGLPPVSEDTVLFKDDHHAVGKVFEVFGPVSHPFYVLQFSSPEHIEAKGIKIHDAVYFAPSVDSFTQYIFPEKIKQEKGSDASWKNDEEPPPEALEFSDDEKERAAKQQKKSQNLRRKKFKSQQGYDENGVHSQPRQQYPPYYSGGYCRGEPHPTVSRGRFPNPTASPRFFRQRASTPQHYSHRAEQWKPSAFCQQQRPDNVRRNQYSFPPPSYETVNNEANFPFPQPSVNWGWPPEYTQYIYDPLSLFFLPPPPPPPTPPPSTVPPYETMNPP